MPPTNMMLWIDRPEDPDASQALRSLIEARIETEMLDRMKEEDVQSPQGQYEIASATLGVLDTLPTLATAAVEAVAHDANKSGIYRVGEHENIREFLSAYIDPSRSGGVIADASFLLDQVVPYMETHGLDPSQIIGKNDKLSSKFRAAVPLLRDATHENENPAEVEKAWDDILGMAADPDTKEDEIRAQRQNKGKKVPIIQGLEFIEKNGESIIVMRLSRKQRALFDNRMAGKVELENGHRWPKSVRSVK